MRFLYLVLLSGLGLGCTKPEAPVEQSSAENPARQQTVVTPVAQAEPADLVFMDLRLQPGDRIPLVKSVTQSVDQQVNGRTVTAETRLDLHVLLTVSQVASDSTLFAVKYTRARYMHNVGGNYAEYDSARPTGAIPNDALPYVGLAGNGYSVRIGRNHQITELVGHEEFLTRCTQAVPLARRARLMNEAAVRFGDEGIAGFVPDTFSLLPFDADAKAGLATRVQQGDAWKWERRLMQPIPVQLNATCRLVRVTPKTAEVDIAGQVVPGTTYTAAASAGADASTLVQGIVRLKGGTTLGRCLVSRRTGLPLESTRTDDLEVEIKTPRGQIVTQQKQIVTSVRMFPQETGPVVQQQSQPKIVPVSGEQSVRLRVQRIPVQTP